MELWLGCITLVNQKKKKVHLIVLCACLCWWKITTVDCLAVARQRACSGAWFLCGSFRDANVPVVREGASEIKTLFLPPGEEYPKQSYSAVHWITLHFSSHLSFSFFLFFPFPYPLRPPKRPILMSRLYKHVGVARGCVLTRVSAKNLSPHGITRRTQFVGADTTLFLFFDNLV